MWDSPDPCPDLGSSTYLIIDVSQTGLRSLQSSLESRYVMSNAGRHSLQKRRDIRAEMSSGDERRGHLWKAGNMVGIKLLASFAIGPNGVPIPLRGVHALLEFSSNVPGQTWPARIYIPTQCPDHINLDHRVSERYRAFAMTMS